MRTNLEHSNILSPRIQGLRLNQVTLVISDTLVIGNDGPTVWLVNGGIGDRTIRLPLLQYEKQIILANVGGTNSFNVTDSVGVAVATLGPGTMGIFYAGALAWTFITGASASTSVAIRTVTTSVSIDAADIIVQTNQSGAIVLTLPASAVWAASAGLRGVPLSIFDVSGNAATNNVTINPSGGQTISGLASLTIADNYGGFRLQPTSAGGWVVV